MDLNEYSIDSEETRSNKIAKAFDELVLKEKERRKPKAVASTPVKKKSKVDPGINSNKIRIINGSDGSDTIDEATAIKAKPETIKPTDSAKEKLKKLGMELPSLNKAIPELADIEKAKVLEAEIAREQKKADAKKPKEELKDS